MRTMMRVKFPHEEFNAAARNGTIDQTMKRILEELKPEAVYFTDFCGQRGVIIVLDVASSLDIPRVAEPWFLKFNADVSFHVAMTPEDLGKSGLKALAQKWA